MNDNPNNSYPYFSSFYYWPACVDLWGLGVSGDNVTVALPLFQEASGGASPTSPHQLFVRTINKLTASNAYIRWHYFGDKGFLSTVNYGAYFDEILVGAISYGIPNAPSIKGIYTKDTQSNYMELTRLAMSDKCPKNSESWFISLTVKLLKKSTPHLKGIITYADTAQNHTGIIYKASNFKYLGLTAQKTDLFVDNKPVGKLKGVKYSELDGEWVRRSRKHLFVRTFQ